MLAPVSVISVPGFVANLLLYAKSTLPLKFNLYVLAKSVYRR